MTQAYISNPGSGEVIKGHAIVLAELGLCPFTGKAVRDPATFAGEWDRSRRAEHIVARSGFTRALWDRAAALLRQPLPLNRLFLSFLETEAMNGRYLEAEAILIAAPGELF
jgi:hypothetical protein